MKQHPVPQNITSYQFRLVGEMTLKQFLELAAGIVVAYLSFHLKIPSFIKWPFIVFSAFFGFALAFLPIQGRPLDRWIINFIKSVYSPTRFLWKKKNPLPDYLQPGGRAVSLKKTAPLPIKKSPGVLQEYLATLKPAVSTSTFDQNEKKQLKNIGKLWQATPAIKPAAEPTIPVPVKTAPAPIPIKAQKPTVEPAPPLAPPIAVESAFPVKQKIKPELMAQFAPTTAIPNPPDTPNAVVGMVLSANNKILPNVLIEIIDNQGYTLRALKTNKLGQFFTAAPLNNGNYKIKAEHEGHQFDIINLKAEGKIIPPIQIKAKS